MKKILLLLFLVFISLFLASGVNAYYKGQFQVYFGSYKEPVCGNGIIELGEQCDGSDLGEVTCQDLGFDSGTLACQETCIYDTSNCAYNPLSPSTGGTGGGGGGGTSHSATTGTAAPPVCNENWICEPWTECINGQQTRTCTDLNNCGSSVYKPDETRACVTEQTQGQQPESTGISPTGAVIGARTLSLIGLYALAIIVAIVAAIYLRARMSRGKVKAKTRASKRR